VATSGLPHEAFWSYRSGAQQWHGRALGAGAALKLPANPWPLRVEALARRAKNAPGAVLLTSPQGHCKVPLMSTEGKRWSVTFQVTDGVQESAPAKDPAKEARVQEYLERHQVHEFLTAVFDHLLSQKPSDPYGFLADCLQKASDVVDRPHEFQGSNAQLSGSALLTQVLKEAKSASQQPKVQAGATLEPLLEVPEETVTSNPHTPQRSAIQEDQRWSDDVANQPTAGYAMQAAGEGRDVVHQACANQLQAAQQPQQPPPSGVQGLGANLGATASACESSQVASSTPSCKAAGISDGVRAREAAAASSSSQPCDAAHQGMAVQLNQVAAALDPPAGIVAPESTAGQDPPKQHFLVEREEHKGSAAVVSLTDPGLVEAAVASREATAQQPDVKESQSGARNVESFTASSLGTVVNSASTVAVPPSTLDASRKDAALIASIAPQEGPPEENMKPRDYVMATSGREEQVHMASSTQTGDSTRYAPAGSAQNGVACATDASKRDDLMHFVPNHHANQHAQQEDLLHLIPHHGSAVHAAKHDFHLDHDDDLSHLVPSLFSWMEQNGMDGRHSDIHSSGDVDLAHLVPSHIPASHLQVRAGERSADYPRFSAHQIGEATPRLSHLMPEPSVR